MSYHYFAWQGNVYECEVLEHILQDSETPTQKWLAVVRPSPQQRQWVSVAGMQPNGVVGIPANVVRTSREEATADIAIGALRNFGQAPNVIKGK